jgi:hypothetical protein
LILIDYKRLLWRRLGRPILNAADLENLSHMIEGANRAWTSVSLIRNRGTRPIRHELSAWPELFAR